MEEEGTRFVNIRTRDPAPGTAGPIAAALVFTALMAGLLAVIIWGFTVSPENAPPLGAVLVLAAVPLVLIAGVLLALVQRIRQIKGGEEDAAAQIDHIPGKQIEALGLVKGSVVQSKNFGKDFMASMKTLVGGEIESYTQLLSEARQIATKRMVDEAEALGADAVVNIRFASSSSCRAPRNSPPTAPPCASPARHNGQGPNPPRRRLIG